MERKRILITGASGFIGSHLVDTALERGYQVYAGIRKSSSRRYLQDPSIRFVEIDIDHPERVFPLLQKLGQTGGVHHVIHNAGVTKPKRIGDFMRGNADFTRHFAETLVRTQPELEKFVFISSLASLGIGEQKAPRPLTEETPANPISPYGKSKLAGEQYLRNIPGLRYQIFRPTAVYGPRDNKFILGFVKLLQKGLEIRIAPPDQRVSFIHVRDLQEAIFSGLESDIINETFNLSDGQGRSVAQVFQIIKTLLDYKTVTVRIPRRIAVGLGFLVFWKNRILNRPLHLSHHRLQEFTARYWEVDISKAQEMLNYTPVYQVENGIPETLRWFEEAGWL